MLETNGKPVIFGVLTRSARCLRWTVSTVLRRSAMTDRVFGLGWTLGRGHGMTLTRFFKRMAIEPVGKVLVLRIGEMEIWDGADLALLREGLTQIIERDGARAIAIDMTYVKYIPSGFFGMLVDWQEKRNVSFWLTTPQPNVQAMLWFRQFFRPTDSGWHELSREPIRDELPNLGPEIEACLVEKR